MIIENLLMNIKYKLLPFKLICDIRIFLFVSLILFNNFTSADAAGKHIFEAESAKLIGGALKVADDMASGGYLVSLTKAGEGIKFTGLPAAGKLAILYASMKVGVISVVLNNQPVQKVNIHSSGAFTNCVLRAIINIAIHSGDTLTISLTKNDVTVNIDQIVVGDGDLGSPPDIWNLPPLSICAGPYSADWKALLADLYRSRMVARRQVRRMVALGPAIHARSKAIGTRAECIWRAVRNINTTSNISGTRRNMATKTSATTG